MLLHIPHNTNNHPPSFLVGPQIALFVDIDLHCYCKIWIAKPQATMPEEDEVTYDVNKDSVGWVEQHIRRHVYIELKLKCTCNRSRNVHKVWDDWLCLYC